MSTIRKRFVHRIKGLCALSLAFVLAAMVIPGMPAQTVKAAEGDNYYFIVNRTPSTNGLFSGQESLPGKHVYDELNFDETKGNNQDNGYVKDTGKMLPEPLEPSQGSPLTRVAAFKTETKDSKGQSDTFTLDVQTDVTFYIGCVAQAESWQGVQRSGSIITAKIDDAEVAVTTGRFDAGKTSFELPAGKYEISFTFDFISSSKDPDVKNQFPLTLNFKTIESYAGAAYFPIKVSQSNGKIKISWDKQEKAANYEVYINYCGGSLKKAVKKTTGKSVTIKKINNKKINFKKNFKCEVIALNSNGREVARSARAHIAGKDNAGYTNPKSIKLSTKKISVAAGKTKKIKASVISENDKKKMLKHVKALRFESDKPSVATVDKNGKVKGIKKGTCNVYVMTQNGLCMKVPITVSE